MRANFVVKDPCGIIVDAVRLDKDIAPVDPFLFGAYRVFGDRHGVCQAIETMMESHDSFVQKHPVIVGAL